ncbi:hypothetical protein, partial [Klebsiella pneumoniae]|uniref:hypothetical protein n=1 Tax=Klebsiella pneumoniae TaxID=573 RepID=UPI003C6CCCE9
MFVFLIVGIALIASLIVALIFNACLGVYLLANRKPWWELKEALFYSPGYMILSMVITRVI